jgi:hypothetical protein
MNRVATVLSLSGVIFVGPPALADSTNQPAMSRHQMVAQMVGCMKKRMAANRNASYNDAMKACKDQINKERDNSPPGALVASDSAAKP